MTMEKITDIVNPINGKQNIDIFVDPNNAHNNKIMEKEAA